MPQFTTPITNTTITDALPDLSILVTLYDAGLTLPSLVANMEDVSFRKKLQTLLEFEFDEATSAALLSELKASYIVYAEGLGGIVTESNGNLYVDGKLTTLYADEFSDGVFENATLSALFFTTDVMDAVLSSGDESFINAMMGVSNFWDKLLAQTLVVTHIETTYNAILMERVNTQEIPYVKYVAYLAGLDFTRYKDILFLAEDASGMETISATPAAKAVEDDAKYGAMGRMIYAFGNSSIEVIAADQSKVDLLSADASLRSIVVDLDVVKILPEGSLMRDYVLDNDSYFGAIASDRLSIPGSINMSNLFFDETYSAYLDGFVQDDLLVDFLLQSELYPTFSTKFYDAFTSLGTAAQEYSMYVNEATQTLTISYANKSFEAKQLSLSLASFTETKVGNVLALGLSEYIFFTPYTFDDASIFGVSIYRDAVLSNPLNYNLYGEFDGVSLASLTGGSGHLMGIDGDGIVVSSKFVTSIDLSAEEILAISVMSDNAFIKTDTNIHVIGNLGIDKADITNVLNVNKASINKVVYFNSEVLALDNLGVVSSVDATQLTTFSPLSAVTVTDIFIISGKLVVLGDTGSLIEITAAGSSNAIASTVTNPKYAQGGLVCDVAGAERAIFNNSGTWLVYDMAVNTL